MEWLQAAIPKEMQPHEQNDLLSLLDGPVGFMVPLRYFLTQWLGTPRDSHVLLWNGRYIYTCT